MEKPPIQLELDGILSKDSRQIDAEKLKNSIAGSEFADGQKEEIKPAEQKQKIVRPRNPHYNLGTGSTKKSFGFVESIKRKSSDPERRKRKLEEFRRINERKDFL